MSLQTLQSIIPGAVSTYGQAVPQTETRQYIYDGQYFPRFLFVNGGDPEAYHSFLRQNRVGDPFAVDLGTAVQVIQSQQAFLTHPES